jgi:hypothetical protein
MAAKQRLMGRLAYLPRRTVRVADDATTANHLSSVHWPRTAADNIIFSPDDVAKEFSDTIKSYGISTVRGDRYGGMWPRERFAVHGIDYQVATMPKSDIYLSLLPLLNSGRAELLDHSRLTAQLCALERRTARGGKDSVDHSPGAHDDIVNAAAGALVMASQRSAQAVPLLPPIIINAHNAEQVTPTASATALWYDSGGYDDGFAGIGGRTKREHF